METKAGQNGTDLPKAEIDTRAPFKSVKAAVSLFGEVAFTSDRSTVRKPKPPPPESGLPKETQLHLAKKELNKYREQLDNAAKTRTHALVELERVRRTFEELTNKLNAVNESKELALKATDVAKAQTKNLEDVSSVETNGHDGGWEQEFNNAREQYAIVVVELNAAKQELRRIRKDFEASTEAKLTAIYQEAKAKQLLDACNENVAQLSMEIRTSQESLADVKLVTEQAQQEESKIRSEKDSSKQACKQALEETERKMASLKKESDPQVLKNLEAKLAETASEIGAVKKEMEVARASDLELFTAMGAELDGAKGMLQKLAEEESWFRSLVDSLTLELGAVKNERAELKEKDAETGYVVSNLNLKIQKCKAELEAAMAAESKATSASDNLVSAPQQLSSAEKKKSGEELRDEAEKKLQGAPTDADVAVASETNVTISKEEYESLTCKVEESERLMESKVAAAMAQVEELRDEAEKKLQGAPTDADVAVASEANVTISKEEYESLTCKVEESERLMESKVAAAMAQVEELRDEEKKLQGAPMDADVAVASEANVTISKEEYESLTCKVEESEWLMERKVAAAMAQVEVVRASETEVSKKLEAAQKEMEEIEAATKVALKRAEMAEAAKNAVEGELRRWRDKAQQRAGETHQSAGALPPRPTVHNVKPGEKSEEHRKVLKAMASRKTFLSNLSGILHRKKSPVDGGGSPSHPPGEKPL
ncbi:WEB family protein At5g55860-like [Musa acuminata AAA Group]|uniref:WEB family protein At5g55860-like n=1 Tax=Musa acuminata AAA Group TaxID=214697 RepID=UPI0031D37AFA